MAKVYDPILCMMVEEKVSTKDQSTGSVEEYYNKMVGKSKPEVEKIVASAKGNPNADLAYKKWKSTSTKDAAYEEVESKGSYMLAKSESGRWAVLKNGIPLKYGMEKDMREFYKRVLKANGLDECPEGMTCDKRSVDEAIRMCDIDN